MSDAPDSVRTLWDAIMTELNEAEVIMLYEMLGDSIRMQQEANVQNTPESEDEVFQWTYRRNGLLN